MWQSVFVRELVAYVSYMSVMGDGLAHKDELAYKGTRPEPVGGRGRGMGQGRGMGRGRGLGRVAPSWGWG